MPSQNLYDPAYVRNLFNEMAATYGAMNLITSFGFAALWRHQCVRKIHILPAASVVDLMTGMGELCPTLAARIGPSGSITGIDISPVMCEHARRNTAKRFPCAITILEADALHSPIEDSSVDIVTCSFGLKTLNSSQWQLLANEVHRILKPGGEFSFLEISTPPFRLLCWPYLFYLSKVVPFIGWCFLKNPDCYRMLGIYTAAFQNASGARICFQNAGLITRPTSYFFGCATGFSGTKPLLSSSNSPDIA